MAAPQPPAAKPPEAPEARPPAKVEIGEAKTLGMVGAILNLVGLIAGGLTGFGLILLIVGVILIYMGVSRISERVADPRPKRYYLKYLIFGIIAVLVIIVGAIVAIFTIGFGFLWGLAGGIGGMLGALGAALILVIVSLVVAYILIVIAAINLRKSYDILKDLTKVGTFGIAGLMYLLGAALFIVLVGGILLLVAIILELVAWASLPESIEVPGAAKAEGAVQPTSIV